MESPCNESPRSERRACYGGHMGKWYTVSPTEGSEPLECFACHDESLYHDSFAYWNDEECDLLCTKCYQKKDGKNGTNYIKVLTQH